MIPQRKKFALSHALSKPARSRAIRLFPSTHYLGAARFRLTEGERPLEGQALSLPKRLGRHTGLQSKPHRELPAEKMFAGLSVFVMREAILNLDLQVIVEAITKNAIDTQSVVAPF